MRPRSSQSNPLPAALPDLVDVGRVLRPHGVRGEVLIESWSEHQARFAPGASLLAGGRALALVSSRPHQGRLLARFEGIEDRDQAESLRDAVLQVPRQQVPPATPGAYYHFELVGCTVEDRRRGPLGLVESVVEDGGGVLLRVRVAGAGESPALLLPFVAAFLVVVDVAARRIEVELPEGLIETCASTS
jgi:16S rRNA processing protein RimM